MVHCWLRLVHPAHAESRPSEIKTHRVHEGVVRVDRSTGECARWRDRQAEHLQMRQVHQYLCQHIALEKSSKNNDLRQYPRDVHWPVGDRRVMRSRDNCQKWQLSRGIHGPSAEAGSMNVMRTQQKTRHDCRNFMSARRPDLRPADTQGGKLYCWRQRGFSPGCRFQPTLAKSARSRAEPELLRCVDGSTLFILLDQFGIGTNTSARQSRRHSLHS